MYGTSYVGATQWLAAIAAPPSLRAIAPAFTASDYYEGWTYQGGAFEWGFMCNWVLPMLTTGDLLRTNERQGVPDFDEWRQRLITAIDNANETAMALPLRDIPVNPEWTPYFSEWMDHPTDDDFWQSRSIEDDMTKSACRRSTSPAGTTSSSTGRSATSPASSSRGRRTRRERDSLAARPVDAYHAAAGGVRRGRFRRTCRAELDAAQHGRRRDHLAFLRSLAEGDRQRYRRRAAGAPLRHG